MGYRYEMIEYSDGFPIKLIVHSVDGVESHWHNEMEILLILKGTVDIRIGDRQYRLKEDDIIVINRNEIHSTNRTEEDNILLALQVDTKTYDTFHPQFSKMQFHCKSFLYSEDEQEPYNILRQRLAEIAWEFNKKGEGYQLRIASIVHAIGAFLMLSCDYSLAGDGKGDLTEDDLAALQRIVDYIDQNLHRKITLKELAEREHVNYYYLSHFIKNKLGISFQEYLNSARLNKAVSMLLSTNKTIIDITDECGFASTNAFGKLFREQYNCSPTEYRDWYINKPYRGRETISTKEGEMRSRTYLDFDRDTALEKLFEYLEISDKSQMDHSIVGSTTGSILADASTAGTEFEHYWRKLTTFSRASEGLRGKWQSQLKELQRDAGFEYIRFHGIFNDEMMVYNTGPNGKVVYNWSYVDELFDFFMKVGIKPFVELGFMPSELKTSDKTMFWWGANISPPRDIALWTDLVQDFIVHCVDRYGLDEVESWYFEVWNEPELENVFWVGGQEEYFKFYKDTTFAIKEISPDLKVGGPAISYQAETVNTWLEDFLDYCNENNIPLDFVSFHIYPERYMMDEAYEKMLEHGTEEDLQGAWLNIKRIYADENNTYDTINSAVEKIEKHLPYRPEIHITEWNASAYGRNLIHDTSYVATFIIDNVLKCAGTVDSIGYWTFTDIMEETKAGISHFHGGFGLINKDGLKKPSYYAYYLLSKLGDRVIAQGEDYIVTKRGDDIQILAYNFAYFDDLFLNGDVSALSETERYLVFEEKPTKEIEIDLSGLEGRYKVTRYVLNREHGSVFDKWVEMGAPENMTEEELESLKGQATPNMSVEYVEVEGTYKTKAYLPVHGVEFIMLENVFSK